MRQMRHRAGLTQREPAARTGIAQPNISAYESGRLTPSATTLSRFDAATRSRPSELVATMRREIAAVVERHKASHVRVFGSAAIGADTTSSDLDLLVHFRDDARLYDQVGLTLYDQVGLTHDLEALLGVRVDVISDGAAGIDRLQDVVAL